MAFADRIQLSDIEDNLSKIVVVTINDDTYKILDNMTLTESLALLQIKLKKMAVKAIGYDIHFTQTSNNDFYQSVLNSNIPTVFAEPNWLTEQVEYRQLGLPISHPVIETTSYKIATSFEDQMSWVGKESIVLGGMVKDNEAQEIPLASALILADDRNKTIPSKYGTEYFSEEKITKISLQEIILTPNIANNLKGKYILVGGDHENLDVFTTIDNEKVNGVFAHAILAAVALSSNGKIVQLEEFILPDELPF